MIENLFVPVPPMPMSTHLPEENPQPIVDLQALWERVEGDAPLLREIVALFLATGPEHLAALRSALTQQDSLALAQAAHRFKGALGNISALDALVAVRRVEALAVSGDLPAASVALMKLEEAVARLTPLLAVFSSP